MKPRPVYSVRRAKKNLLDAIRYEVRVCSGLTIWSERAKAVAAREKATRNLIASVRAECGK